MEKNEFIEESRDWSRCYDAEALAIDPETAEVSYEYVHMMIGDPYEMIYYDGEYCFGRAYFARNPGSTSRVPMEDLPHSVYNEIMSKHRQKFGYPERHDGAVDALVEFMSKAV